MRIAITGANGQLGNSLKIRQQSIQGEWIFTDVSTLDLTNEKEISTFFRDINPDILINCAAYTAVDNAETDKKTANAINSIAPAILAKNCQHHNCKFIHISTDYVFDGTAHIPYKETDTCKPQSVYGKTKLAGEQAVTRENPNAIIIRTSWLYSEFGHNFLKTMICLGAERKTLNVVFDQIGSPTWAGSLANGIIHIIKLFETKQIWTSGIFHYSNQGVCSWYDFAYWIMKQKTIDCTISPIESKEYPMPAKRPHYSVLNKSKFEKTFNINIPHWQDAAEECLKVL